MTKKLLTTFRMHDIELSNRVVLAPMTRARAGADRIPNDLMKEYYVQRASAGLIITEAVSISEQGIGWMDNPGIYNDAQARGWEKVVSAVHEAGGRIFLQLWHCGRASHSSFHNGELPVAPSAVKLEGDHIHTPDGKKPYETPRALKTGEIPAIVDDYRKAAIRAKECGFDGIEVHSANGYLLDQFLQSGTNQRDDEYGGSPENRYRLLDEVLNAVFTVWPAERVAVRLSPNGVFNDMGSADFRETFTYVIQQFNNYNLAYLHVLDGLAFGFHEKGDPMNLHEMRSIFDKPLMGNCGYDFDKAESAISDGDADFIAFGRPYISNPDLVERFANDYPLNPDADMSVWYAPIGAEGYTDFPFYESK